MKLPVSALVVLVAATAGQAQTAANTGVSRPEPVIINTTPDETLTVKIAPAKPSAAVPATLPGNRPNSEVYGPYVPYRGGQPNQGMASRLAADPDGRVVTSVPESAGEVREGTLLHVKMHEALSTLTTAAGSSFSAELTAPVERNGRVVLPVGSVLEGRVSEVHSGRRISGRALLHLEAHSLLLPDGTHYNLRAQLIDSDRLNHTAVDGEGSLIRKDNAKETLAVMAGTTGVAAVAGGLLGGGVGAIVGAGIGAGASTVVWLKQDRQAELPADARLIFSLTEPMSTEPEGRVDHGFSARETAPGTVANSTPEIASQR